MQQPKKTIQPTPHLEKQSDLFFAKHDVKHDAKKMERPEADRTPSDRIEDRRMEEPERWDGMS